MFLWYTPTVSSLQVSCLVSWAWSTSYFVRIISTNLHHLLGLVVNSIPFYGHWWKFSYLLFEGKHHLLKSNYQRKQCEQQCLGVEKRCYEQLETARMRGFPQTEINWRYLLYAKRWTIPNCGEDKIFVGKRSPSGIEYRKRSGVRSNHLHQGTSPFTEIVAVILGIH